MNVHPLRLEREQRGWSQARLATELGVTTRTIVRWESGQARPFPYYREQICRLFGKDALELGLVLDSVLEDVRDQAPLPVTPPLKVEEEMSAVQLLDPMLPRSLHQVGGLLGRDELLAQVAQSLCNNDDMVLTALNGLPGIGKTTLAIALAADSQVRQHFHDGILWAGLGPKPDVLSVLVRWGKLLGIAPSDVENVNDRGAWGRALHATIGSRQMLLVIDDAWSSEDAMALQVGGLHCAHLLTTRLPLVAFAFAQKEGIIVPELQEDDGLALLARFIPELVEQDQESARVIVRAVGGLPLALTLIGRHLAGQAFTGQPRRLRKALSQLQDTQQRLRLSMPAALLDTSTHRSAQASLSLQATIAISDEYLTAQSHNALCALALFPSRPNSFSEAAALAVSEEPIEVLDELWDSGLLESVEAGRYALHQTIADYAAAQTKDTHACERLVKYTLNFVQEHIHDYEVLDAETANIFTALDLAVELQQWQDLRILLLALTDFMRVRGLYSQANHYLQQALAGITPENQKARAELLYHLAAFAILRTDYTQAESYGQQGLTVARELALTGLLSGLLTTLGQVAFARGDYDQAKRFSEEGLQFARQLNDSKQICAVLCYLGDAERGHGNYKSAEDFYREGLALAQLHEYQEQTSRMLASLGLVIQRQGDYERADAAFAEGLKLARELGHQQLIALQLTNWGLTYIARGAVIQADTYLQEALAVNKRIGQREQICQILLHLSIIEGPIKEDFALSKTYLEEGIELARQSGFYELLPRLLDSLAFAVGYLGDYEGANAYFQQSLDLSREQKGSYITGWILANWAEIHLRFNQVDAAWDVLQEVFALSKNTQSDFQVILKAKYLSAVILALRGNTAEAYPMGKECLALLERFGSVKAKEVRDWLATLPESKQAAEQKG